MADYDKIRSPVKSPEQLFENGLSKNTKNDSKVIWPYIKSKSKTREEKL